MATIGIAGAGLLGRLLAWRLTRAGHRVTVFDPAAGPAPVFDGRDAAAFTAAGMLSPVAELENASPSVARLGLRSIVLWRQIVAALPGSPFFAERGSLLLAHRSDLGAAERILARLSQAGQFGIVAEPLTEARLHALETALCGVARAWFLAGEAHIDPVGVMAALYEAAAGATWRFGAGVVRVMPRALRIPDQGWQHFDTVFDVRGAGARPDLPVRGVRGETVWLHAPGLGLSRPLRLLHPRHRVYIVPRPGDVLIVGASEIESEDRSPVSLKSAVELMTAAHSVLPQLSEARILRLDRNLRPALADHEPHSEIGDGLVRINGLFRHGWLLAPALVDDALAATGLAQAPQALPESTPL
ncbi:MAG TPA: FAD-dependent oxidoreductase [Burkholderiaceae bacterium]|jgi:glycine oxidase|nr:FAD-dependent oxidoreductase [Burkholderiaceae bacterium]